MEDKRVVLMYLDENNRIQVVDKEVYDCNIARHYEKYLWINLKTIEDGVQQAKVYHFEDNELLYLHIWGEEQFNAMTKDKLKEVIKRIGENNGK